MTREEAITVLNMVEAHGLADKAKHMAIKALEFDLDKHDEEVIKNTVETLWGEPCEDCVSREEVLNYIKSSKEWLYRNENFDIDMQTSFEDIEKFINNLPSVQPKVKECEDCISREAAIKVFGDVHPMDYNTQAYITNIQNLPSVIPDKELCDDAISKASVFEIIGNLMAIPYDFDRPITEKDVSESMDEIKDLPSVTPQPKTGRWIYIQYDGNPRIGNWKCSLCMRNVMFGQNQNDKPLYNYCPNCGAKMQEG